jgi:alpha-tubulin suppressor-like RCC1 family protein
LSNVVAVAAGGLRWLALKSDGTVVGWGRQEGDASAWSNIASIAASETHRLALKRDGTVLTSASRQELEVPKGLTDVVAIAAGFGQSVVIKKDGGVVAWGDIEPGGMAVPPPPAAQSNVVSFALGNSAHGENLALKRDGTVVEWACRGIEDQMTLPAALTNVVAIAVGNAHCLALKMDGTVVAWGLKEYYYENPNFGQTDVPPGLSNVVAIAAGGNTSLALKRDGTVVSWGGIGPRFPSPVPAGLSNVVGIAVGRDYCIAVQTSGTVTETNIVAAHRAAGRGNP